MKIIPAEIYQCEFCKTDYHKKEDCEQCETSCILKRDCEHVWRYKSFTNSNIETQFMTRLYIIRICKYCKRSEEVTLTDFEPFFKK